MTTNATRSQPAGHPDSTPATDPTTGQIIGWYYLGCLPTGRLVRRWIVHFEIV
jgi:hypothetical protein